MWDRGLQGRRECLGEALYCGGQSGAVEKVGRQKVR